MTFNICGGIYASDSSPDLACGPEVAWLPPIMNAFPEDQTEGVCPSSHCVISCWFSIGGRQPKGPGASLVNSLYPLPRLFPALSFSSMHAYIQASIRRTHLLSSSSTSNILQGSRACTYSGDSWGRWQNGEGQPICRGHPPLQLVVALWTCRPTVPCPAAF